MTVPHRSDATNPAPSARNNGLFSVRLIDLRTGEVPSVNGNPLSVVTDTPRQAEAELMKGRDRALWQTQVDPVGPDPARPALARTRRW
ncbi:hypothetical protein [Paracoccus aestuariivivens]|uniref:Uncharacterized protein n=1 Tax=Paracoccus aestuariivivens TaxID=1820333 RepID=A0A6L6JC56_9RHOB|nr:hypothetical protein [Paracoccus aestuariivivens]MTH79702.1 hypothetical protein [Paracoccus aestuariivivens]